MNYFSYLVLRLVQIILRKGVKSVLEYLEKHPEAREKVDAEDAVKRVLGSDFDVDVD